MSKIAIKKQPNGTIYIDNNIERFGAEYIDVVVKECGYIIINVDDQFKDCQTCDFNEDMTFSVEKYNSRKQLEEKQMLIPQLKQELTKWKEDVEQVELFGMDRSDYEEKKKRCAEIILELRVLEKEVNTNE